MQDSAGHVSQTYAKRASHASSTLIPSVTQTWADVSRTGRVTPIPSPVINLTFPGNPRVSFRSLKIPWWLEYRPIWDHLVLTRGQYCSESWFRTDHGASAVGIPEYDTLSQPSVCAQETRTRGRIAAGISRSLAIFIPGLKMEKVCYFATSTGNRT